MQRKKVNKFGVIDCETDPFEFGAEIKPFIWGYYDGEKHKTFYKTRDLITFLKGLTKTDIYAHNGGKFDYHFLLDYAERNQDVTVINGRLSKWKIGKCTLYDSYNLLPVPLSAINKDEFDYNKMHKKRRHLFIAEIEHYLKNDCLYLYNALNEFFNLYGQHLTLAGAGMDFWKKIGNKRPKSTPDFFDLFRKYYYGGRTQAFQAGIFEKDFFYYDIRSAYPFVMKNKLHPIGTNNLDYFQTTHPKDNEIEHGFFSVSCHSKGAFPLRDDNNRLNFPVGKSIFHVTGHELKTAIETKTISDLKIKSGFVWHKSACINFAEYVDIFFDKRLKAKRDGNKAHDLFAKLFLNSLYGKFAMNYYNFCDYQIVDAFEDAQEGFEDGEILGDVKIISKPIDEIDYNFINVATSASITGAVRAYLWESIQKCENVYYCDTDSIICENGDQLNVGEKLGNWELEAKGDKLAIAGKKLYCLTHKNELIKKASKGANLTPDEIFGVAKGGVIKYEKPAPCFSLKMGTRYIDREIKSTFSPELNYI